MAFRLKENGGVACVECEELTGIGLVHAFCTRLKGVSPQPFASLNFSVSEGDGAENVRSNYEIVSAAYSMAPEAFFTVRQVHSDSILLLDSFFFDPAGQSGRMEYDAVLTAERGMAVCVKTADCAPVFLADRDGSAVAAVHAGWRGTSLGIAGKAALFMMGHFGMKGKDLVAAVGPSICRCCYEVDSVVRDAMRGLPGQDLFVPCGAEKWKFDLPGANRLQLVRAGVPEGNIFLSGLCTSCDTGRFFSHRAEGRTGRMLNFLMIPE